MDRAATKQIGSPMYESGTEAHGDGLQGSTTLSFEHNISSQTSMETKQDSGNHPVDVLTCRAQVEGRLESIQVEPKALQHSHLQVSTAEETEGITSPINGESMDDKHTKDTAKNNQASNGGELTLAIHLCRMELALHPPGHPDRGMLLKTLATALLKDYRQVGDTDALPEVVCLFREAITLHPHDLLDHSLGSLLDDLAGVLLIHYGQTGDTEMLATTIQLLHEVVGLSLQGHPNHISLLNHLANALLKRYEQTGDTETLAETISLNQTALALCPYGHPNRGSSLKNLADALSTYYEQIGGIDVLLKTICLYREAISLCSQGQPNHSSSLSNLAIAILTHYEQTGDTDALSEAICLLHKVLALRPDGHPNRSISLSNLGYALLMRYEHSGDTEILAESVHLLREAHVLFPQGHTNRNSSLNNLANALMMHYEQFGALDVLMEAINLHREALALCQKGHPAHSSSPTNLGYALFSCYQQTGDTEALAEAIQLLYKALALRIQGHPERGSSLSNLAEALMAQYKQAGNRDTLVEAIHLLREGLTLIPQGHPDRNMVLNNLANALNMQYKQTGDMDALAEMIRLLRETLILRPQGHPKRCHSLSDLANALNTHYKQSDKTNALAEATQLHREALTLCPQGHPDRGSSLSSLANTLRMEYEQSRNVDTLAETIHLLRAALALHPIGHPERGGSLNNLANALLSHYEKDGDRKVLAETISLCYAALSIFHQGHPERGSSLNNLAISHLAHFQRDGDENALLNVLKFSKGALGTWPDGHPDRYEAHHTIARMQLVESSHFNWMEALDHLMQATTDNSVSPRKRLHQAIRSLHWVEGASAPSSQGYSFSMSALDVYIAVIQLLPHAAHVGLDLSTRLRELSGSEQLCRAATVRAVLLQQLHTAVEILEEGKAVFWLQALRLRSTELDALPVGDRDKLLQLFRSLEQDSSSLLEGIQDKTEMESWIEHRRQMSKQADVLIEEIRLQPGFDRFLKIPQFSTLAQAAANGFVVALVANEQNFFAIVIHANNAPQHISLKSINNNMLRKLCAQVTDSGMRDHVCKSGPIDHNVDRGISKEKTLAHAPLAQIWCTIIEPIIVHLGLQRALGQQRPRIHWYPSGVFALLPLHAAGIYEGNSQVCTSDFIVSSYTPSLSALIKSRKSFLPVPREELQALVFGEPSAPGLLHLPSVEKEVQTVVRIFSSASATVANDVGDVPTAHSVLNQLPTTHILHVACHGHQDLNPLQSCFILRDGPLTISALMEINLPNALIAFLSACETAKGDTDQPDQAVHLAASMLFCGFRSVIATMWSMYDDDGPLVAQWFYEALLDNEIIDLNDIPYAFDTAMQKLRKSGASASRWATYIHMGA